MKKQFIISLRMLGIMTLLLGVAYPLFITGFGQLFYPFKANGSLVEINGEIRGSLLIGQQISEPQYFKTRPSATAYNTLASGASNLGLTNKKLHETVKVRKAIFLERNRLTPQESIPSEMLFASASGLDPHISPKAAKMQVNRIAEVRNLSTEQKQQLVDLVDKLSESPQFEIFGCPRINVFLLNLELDKIKQTP